MRVTIAQASSSLLLGVTGSVLLPRCVLSCQRPQWNKLNPDTSLSEVPAYTYTLAGGWSSSLLLLYFSVLPLSLSYS